MAQLVHRVNLSATSFPLLSRNQGRPVIVRGQDQNYVNPVASKEDTDKDIGIPQVYYCHNVMPTQNGFESVSYDTQISGSPSFSAFTSIFLLRDPSENKVYFVHTLDGKNYILKPGGGTWIETTPVACTGKVTVAHVQGQSYIYFEAIGCYRYDYNTNTLVAVTLTGLTPSAIIGICGAVGYLIAWGTASVAWSSTIDPTDFVPSLTTGAGTGSVEGAQGAINICVQHTLGFIVYTTENTVAALYSSNARYPFNFRPIVSSGGAADLDLVTYDSNSGSHYAYTTSGLQLISAQGTQTIFPEVTDFISGQYFEDFDETTLILSTQKLSFPLQKKLTVVADRYFVLSYGISALTHALVYDLVQRRWGKLRTPHVDCFEYQLLNPTTTEIPRKSLAFIQADGTIKTVNFANGDSTTSGVLILGKYQYVRTRLLQLDAVAVETVTSDSNFNLYDAYSLDGKVPTGTVAGYLAYKGPLSRDYNFRLVGLNHSLILKGSFYVNSIELTFHVHGGR